MPGPLSGIKILDFSTLLPGPFATMMLSDMGADVTRVAAPGPGDLRPDAPGAEPNPIDATLARNKRCVTLNMKSPASAEVVRRLVAQSDALVEQFRPGVMERLGWGYEAARAVNPRIVYCSLTGYGQTGPLRDRAGHDMNYLSLAGLMSYTGRKETGPAPLPTQVADICAGSYNMLVGLLAALLQRERTGEGQHVDVSMFDGSVALNALSGAAYMKYGVVPGYETEILNGGTLYDIYRTRDGRHLSVGGLEAKFLAETLKAIGRSDLAPPGATMYSIPNKAKAKEAVREAIASKDFAEWVEIFAGYDACVEPVLNLKEALDQPHTRARDLVIEIPDNKGGKARQIGHPIKYSAAAPEYRHSGRAAGADNDAVLRELGFDDAEIANLKAAKALG